MILPDYDIVKRVRDSKDDQVNISPYDVSKQQPASVDLTLGDEFVLFSENKLEFIDPFETDIETNSRRVKAEDGSPFVLQPRKFALGTTIESVSVGGRHVGVINGKSSLGRLGLLIHATAGFIDPGFQGKITLELYNLAPVPILLHPGMDIAQISFYKVDGTVSRPYGHSDLNSKYQNQDETTVSQYRLN